MAAASGPSASTVRTIYRQDTEQTAISYAWWGNDARHQYTLTGIQVFEEKNPDIRVNHTYGVWDGYETRNQVFMKSHTNADVMQINYSWLHTYSPDGTGYYNLNYLTDVLDLSRYTEADLALGTVNGHLNAIPIAYNMSVFFYNKDVYDRYGLDIPETWDDLFQAAEQMSKDGIYPIGMVKKHLFLCLVAHFEQTTGRVLFTADGSYCGTAEDWMEILDFYKQLLEKKVIPRVEDFDATDFENGTTAGAGCWASDATRYCAELSKSGVNVVIGNNIMEPGALRSGWYTKPATLYAISATTQHPKEAARFLNFLINDADMARLQGTEKGVPISERALDALKSSRQVDSLEYAAAQEIREMQDETAIMIPQLESSTVMDAFKNTAISIYMERRAWRCARRRSTRSCRETPKKINSGRRAGSGNAVRQTAGGQTSETQYALRR